MAELKEDESSEFDSQMFEGNPFSKKSRSSVVSSFSTFYDDFSDSLPALRFFWFQTVAPKNRAKYFDLLGQLFELFITPHILKKTPYRSCSFLKKFEYIFRHKYSMFIYAVVQMFKLETSQTEVPPYPFLVERRDTLLLPENLKTLLQTWHRGSLKENLVIQIVLVQQQENHITFLALKKVPSKNKVLLTYIDSHGTGLAYKIPEIKALLTNFLKVECNVQNVVDIVPTCPLLQESSQGGNCTQWFFFNFCSFLAFPNKFLEDEVFYNDSLYLWANANIHLFSLSLFLRTLPQIGLQEYFTGDIYKLLLSNKNQHQAQCMEEDDRIRRADTSAIATPNCYDYATGQCPDPCARCGGTCNFAASVKHFTDGQPCRPLSGKMIAMKMFYIYLNIRKLTKQDPHKMTVQAIREQLDFQEPFTESDYSVAYPFMYSEDSFSEPPSEYDDPAEENDFDAVDPPI